MADSTLNRFVAEGDDTQEAAFTPDPPTPASGPDQAVLFVNKENPATPVLKWWDGSDWVEISEGAGPGSGALVQVVNTQTGASTTGSTIMPLDDTIPQNNEGDEYMTLAITPTDVGNKLRIDVVAFLTQSAGGWITGALFQDSTANALAAMANYQFIATAGCPIVFTHYMTAGTTSATTFKFRAGPDASTTVTFNGQGGSRKYGGVLVSSITISEIVP